MKNIYNLKQNYTSFPSNKIPKEGSQCICLSVLLTDSVYRRDKNYCPHVFAEDCMYIVKEKKMFSYITDDIIYLLMILIEKILIILIKKILINK